MRAALATVFVVVSSAAWAQCTNVNGLICGGAPTGSLSATGTLFSGGSATPVAGSTGVSAGQRAVIGNRPGSVALGGSCVVSLPAQSSVSFTRVNNSICIDGGNQAGGFAPSENGVFIAGAIVGVGAIGAALLANQGDKTVSP